MIKIKEKEVLKTIYDNTHLKSEDNKDVPYFCFVSDVVDYLELDLSEEEVAQIALDADAGYTIFKVFAEETIPGGLLICADGCEKEEIENMYKDFYACEPPSIDPWPEEPLKEAKKKKPKKVGDPNAKAMWGRTRNKVEPPKKGKSSYKRKSKHKKVVEEIDFITAYFNNVNSASSPSINEDMDDDFYIEDDINVEITSVNPKEEMLKGVYELKQKYTDEAAGLGAEISFFEDISPKRIYSFWYDDDIAVIEYNDYVIIIYSYGDVCFFDNTRDNNREIYGKKELFNAGYYTDDQVMEALDDDVLEVDCTNHISFALKKEGEDDFKYSYDMGYESMDDIYDALDIKWYIEAVIPDYTSRFIEKEQLDTQIIKESNGKPSKNDLKKAARRHKKTDKKGARGWFVNPDAGNVEKNIAFFNHATGGSSSGVGEASPGLGEDLDNEHTEEQFLLEGTKYDNQAIKILDDANLFSHETNEKIIQLLYKGDEENEPDIHAFVHSPNWLMKYLKGIARMLVEYAEGSSTKAQEFLGEAPSVFEPVLTWVKTNRTDKNAKELDDNFINKFSFQDVKDFLDEIHSQEQEISDKKLADLDTSKKPEYTLIPINSYEEMREFGNNVTGDSSISVSSPWCYATGRGTYNSWISDKTNKMYVLAKDGYEKIKPEKTENNPKDEYGLSLIGIRINVKTGKLLNATLRWNHLNVPTNADNQFTNYGELSEVVGFNVKEAVEADLDAERERLERLLENSDQYYYDKMLKTGVCNWKTIEEEHIGIIEKIIVPDNIEEIGESAFGHCESLTSITLPDSVVEIGRYAFYECSSLKSITIPNSVKEIGHYAFAGCNSLTSITLPNSVREIGRGAFYGCKSLKDIYIVGKTTLEEQERIKQILRRADVRLDEVNLHFNVQEDLSLIEAFKDGAEFFDEFSDFETYTELSEGSSAFEVVDDIVEELGVHKINLSLDYVVETMNNETGKAHYIATFNGGLNGEGEWSDYLEELEILFDKLECWLISLENDVLDDRFTLKVGFNTIVGDDSGDLGEEFELTEVLPTNNETKEEFVARFMKETEEEYPNPKQRYAVALKYWEKRLAETFEGTEVKKGVRNKMKTKGFLEERFERNETLNPKLWDGDELKEEVRDKIYQIVDAFVAGLTDDNIEISVEDIVLIGSNASYNYSEQSDLDVHVIVDTSNLNCPDGLYPLLYSAYRSIFNKKYEIEFYGIDVELYIDEENTQTVSNGVYSLTQGWIKPPVREDIPEIDEEAFEEMFSEWEDEYFNIVQGEVIPDEKPIQPVTESLESNKIEEIENFIEDIYDLRKVSLSKQGEYSLGNLVFKEFRNLGYLDNLKALKSKLKSQELSITETYKLRESKDMNDYYTLESIKALAEEVQTDNRDGTYSIGEDGKLVKEDLTKGMQTSFFRPEITNSEIKEVLNVIGDSFGKAYLGLWYGDGEISYTLDFKTAKKVAKIFNQQAIWDNGRGDSIDNECYDDTKKVDYKAATEELRKLLKK